MVSPLLFAAIAGGAGGGIANIALSPANSGASLLNSYWYGAGLILGERDMYTFHWEKIKERLEKGEDYLTVLEGEMNPAITAISAYSLRIMKETGELYKKAGVDFMINLIEDLLNPFFSGDRGDSSQLLSFTLLQIQAWTDAELRAAFENKTSFALYDSLTQELIQTQYNIRFTETEPAPIDDPTDVTTTRDWQTVNAQGRIVEKPGRAVLNKDGWGLQTKNNNQWVDMPGLIFLTIAEAIQSAIATWPGADYRQFGFTNPTEIYWTLESKYP